MSKYTSQIIEVLKDCRHDMLHDPSLFDRLSRRVQTRINKAIPEKVHQAITATIKQMVRGILFGAEFTTGRVDKNTSLQ